MSSAAFRRHRHTRPRRQRTEPSRTPRRREIHVVDERGDGASSTANFSAASSLAPARASGGTQDPDEVGERLNKRIRALLVAAERARACRRTPAATRAGAVRSSGSRRSPRRGDHPARGGLGDGRPARRPHWFARCSAASSNSLRPTPGVSLALTVQPYESARNVARG